MKVKGMVDPGRFSVECVPGTNQALVRLYQNVKPYHEEGFDGFQYDEYHVTVPNWDGLVWNVADNYDEFLRQGLENEIDRSNHALFEAQKDTDNINLDHEYRLTLLELGITDFDI